MLYTMWGVEIAEIIEAGKVKSLDLPTGQGTLLLVTLEDGMERYVWAHTLKADRGAIEIDEAIKAADPLEWEVLTERQRQVALNQAS